MSKQKSIISAVMLSFLIAVALFAVSLPVASAETPASATLRLDVSLGRAGGVSDAVLSLSPADGVRGFNLLLQFQPNQLLSANATDFARNSTFLPDLMLGEHALNAAHDAGAGRIRMVGLAPAQSSGTVEIGHLHLHIAANAPLGATQTVSLSGEVNQAGTVSTIAPITAMVHIVNLSKHLYLPLTRRSHAM